MRTTVSGTDGELRVGQPPDARIAQAAWWNLSIVDDPVKPTEWHVELEVDDPGVAFAAFMSDSGGTVELRHHRSGTTYAGNVLLSRNQVGSNQPGARLALRGNGRLTKSTKGEE